MARARQIRYDPITPMRDGQPPGFVVSCLECGFSVDAHGATASDAVQAVAPSHDSRHHLIAQPVNYQTGYGSAATDPHPLYRR